MLQCNCCGLEMGNLGVEYALDLLEVLGYEVTSSLRCSDNNRQCGGSATSLHLRGLALDVRRKAPEEAWWDILGQLRPDFVLRYASHWHIDWRLGCSLPRRIEDVRLRFGLDSNWRDSHR